MALNKKIRVLVVDDSAVYRTMISTNLSKYEDIEIIGTAIDAFDAQKKIETLKPDVLSLDVEMPKMSGIDLIRVILEKQALPIILVSSASITVFDALKAGAVDFVRKPDAKSVSTDTFINELASKIRIASVAKVYKHKLNTKAPAASVPPVAPKTLKTEPAHKVEPTLNSGNINTIITLGASTGGTESTLEVLQRLPANIPPMIIVQHMPPGFTKLYADRLNRICDVAVKEAVDGDALIPGQVYIAPGDFQMRLVRSGTYYSLRCAGTEKVSGHCPSVDVMFDSVSKLPIQNKIGVILTGMGKDGAEGLLKLRNQGAFTIGESKESCVVYGMPMVAYDIGAVAVQADNKDIAGLIINHLQKL
ncbi:MAG: protein-glutamate methylesterase/protein-glutamine glutaminase [Eubacteriales bacterium]